MATVTGGESEDTLDATPSLPPQRTSPSSAAVSAKLTAQTPAVPRSNKHIALALAAAVLLAAVVAGGWFLLRQRNQSSAPQALPQQSATTAPQPTPPIGTPAPAKPQAAVPMTAPKPAPEKPAVKGTAPAIASIAPVAPAAAPQPRMASVTFNPKTLDPKQNTRLKIDLSHFPAGLAFAIQMNGKLFYKGAAGNKADYDNLYVPPGVHEFRVTVGNGQAASNPVSATFVARKHMSLKIELKPQPVSASGAAPVLAPATEVIATLKEDHFFL
jgi:hypothetical protein